LREIIFTHKKQKIMKRVFLALVAIGALFATNSCTKSGPQGPEGPAGPQGSQGEQGPAGVNTQIIGELPVTVDSASWGLNSPDYSVVFIDSNITPAIVSAGSVEVFKLYMIGGDSTWTNLPDINGITSTVFNMFDYGLIIYVQNSDRSVPANPGTQTFRLVVISNTLRLMHPKTNWKNYKEVMAMVKENPQIMTTGKSAVVTAH
jgi:hypothetical protein